MESFRQMRDTVETVKDTAKSSNLTAKFAVEQQKLSELNLSRMQSDIFKSYGRSVDSWAEEALDCTPALLPAINLTDESVLALPDFNVSRAGVKQVPSQRVESIL